MSKKIISIILTLAMILCQGTLCLGTVSAAEDMYIVEPGYIELPMTSDSWSASYATVSNDDEGNLVFADEGHENTGRDRYDSGWMNLDNLEIDATAVYAVEFKVMVENARHLTKISSDDIWDRTGCIPQIYYVGTPDVTLSNGNSTGNSIHYQLETNSDGEYYNDDFVTYTYPLSGTNWDNLETLTTFRIDPIKNGAGVVKIAYIRLITKPGISSLGYNGAYEADIDAVPVDPDTLEINLAGSVTSVDNAITIVDENDNEVPIAGAITSGSKIIISLEPGTELSEFTTYTVTLNENTMVTPTKNLQNPISFAFTTDDSRAPSIFDAVDPDRPSDYTDDNIIWSAEFKSNDDLTYFKSSSGIKTEIAYGEYLKYTSNTPIINANKNLQGYYTDTKFETPVDANMINTLQIRMKIVNAVVDGKITGTVNGETITKDRVPPAFVMYFAGINDDGSSFVMNGSHTHSASYNMVEDEDGNACTEWMIYEYNLNSIKSWVAARDITAIRFDFSNNCESEVLVDYVRLIGPKMPEIEGLKYNSEFELDEVQGLPVNPETVELQLTEPLFEIGTDGIVFEDEYGNDVLIQKVSLLDEGKLLSIYLGQELTPETNYFIGINEKAKIGSSAYVDAPVVAECYVGDYRALTGIELIDPARPSDAILPGEEVWSLDFKSEEEINTHFKSTSNVKTALKYNEYMEYKTESMGVGATSGMPASYYIDSDFSTKKIDTNKHYRLQIRMKIVNQIMKGAADGYFKMYFKGDNGVNMSESNCDGVEYEFRTDSEGRYGTDWFVLELDLSKSAHWLKASSIETVRFDFLKNAAGTVLVDYIRFIALPTVTEVSYTNAQGTTVVEDGIYVPKNTSSINVKLSAPVLKSIKVTMENEFGNIASVDAENIKYDSKTGILSIPLLSQLETSSTYNVKIESSTDFGADLQTTQTLYTPVETSFKTELDPIVATLEVGENSANIAYTNSTSSDVVLVGIATGWDGNKYMGKEMTITEVAAGTTVSDVILGFDSIKDYNVEFVVWQYDIATSTYSVVSKSIINN